MDENKVGKDLSGVIFAKPNCTIKFQGIPSMNVKEMIGSLLDGVMEHLRRFIKVSDKPPIDMDKVLKDTKQMF